MASSSSSAKVYFYNLLWVSFFFWRRWRHRVGIFFLESPHSSYILVMSPIFPVLVVATPLLHAFFFIMVFMFILHLSGVWPLALLFFPFLFLLHPFFLQDTALLRCTPFPLLRGTWSGYVCHVSHDCHGSLSQSYLIRCHFGTLEWRYGCGWVNVQPRVCSGCRWSTFSEV